MTKSSAAVQFTMRELLEAGVHFGHKTRRWNPKMSRFIFGEKDGVHILDLQKTVPLLHSALSQVKNTVARNGRVLFVGTKPQAADAVADAAKRCGQYFINKRWLGGTLTNWQTISDSIRRLRKYDDLITEEGSGLKKKERLEISRKKDRLEASIGGIKDIGGVPDLIVIIDTNKEELAIKEAKKLGIPVIAILDSNCNPEGIDFPIPGNDDSIRAIKLYCKLFSDAVLAGIEASLGSAGVELAKAQKEMTAANDSKPEAGEEKRDSKKKEAPKVETVIKKSRSLTKKKEEAPAAEAAAPAAEEKKPAAKKAKK